MWELARTVKLCDFTDEEMGTAINGNGIIKEGNFGDFGKVIMAVDVKAPITEG